MTIFFKASALSPQLFSLNLMGCQPSNAGNQTCPVCPMARDKEGLTADPGSPHHGIKKSSLHLKDVWGMLMGAEAQQFKFTEVMGRVRQADLTPFPDLPLVYQPTYSHE